MEGFPLFFRIRAITFTIMMLFSFLWFVLLSVEMFARWTTSDHISRSLMILFLLTNTNTLILLPMLILVRFRVWLDAARLFVLLALQAGTAAVGTYWSPKIQCPDQTLDDIGVCQLISVYTEIACWIIPVILVFYSTYFIIVVQLQSRIPIVVETERPSGDNDAEMGSTDSPSLWRAMLKEIVRGSSDSSARSPRLLVLPTMVHTSRSSLTQSPGTPPQSGLPRRQATMPSSLHTDSQHAPSRHRSLPAFKHGNDPYIRPVLTLPIPPPHISTSLPQTPSSSQTYSASSPANPLIHSFDFGPGNAFPTDHWGRSKHLSMMPSSSSPREVQNAQSPATRSKRAKLLKPIPAHFL